MKKRAVNSRQQQQGVAAIMLVLMLPMLLAFITLGLESSRYMAIRGQLQNAAEVAALIISAHGEESKGLGDGLTKVEDTEYAPDDIAKKEKIAEQVVHSMVSEVGDLDVTVTAKTCADNEECDNSGDSQKFYQYQVNVETTHKRWFPDWTGTDLSFDETTTLTSGAVSRKNYGAGVDVVFVADFTNSMNGKWKDEDGNRERRIDTLKRIVGKVATTLEESTKDQPDGSKNRIALVPFHKHTWEKNKDGEYCGKASFIDSDKVSNGNKIKVDDPDKNGDETKNVWLIKQDKVESVIDTLFDESAEDCVQAKQECSSQEGGKPEVGYPDQCEMYTIPLTSSAENLVKKMTPMGLQLSTYSFEGIIRGAQIAKKGTNPFRLIIILSDGRDAGINAEYWHKQLLGVDIEDIDGNPPKANKPVEKSYCDVIRETLNRERSPSGQPVESRIVGVGIGYDAKKDPNLTDCAGTGNVFSPENVEELEEILLELVGSAQEIGSLYYKSKYQ